MNHHEAQTTSRGKGWALPVALCLGLLAVLPAAAQHCTDSAVPGTLIGFTPLPGEIEKPNSCNLLPCYEPEEDGGAYLATDENCDALSGSCPVQMRVPLKFPGNSQMPNNAHVRVYWFDQATPGEDACLPPPLGNCSPISICGPLGAEILVDRGETFIQVGASCASIAAGQAAGGSFSLSAYACQTFSGECTERLDVSGLELPSQEEMWDLLGCDPPPPPCDSCPCGIGGGGGGGGFGGGGGGFGGGSAGGGPPGLGPPSSGPGAKLRYKGRGAGHPGHPGAAEWNQTLGRYWSHDYAWRIVLDPDDGTDDHVWLITETAGFHEFQGLAGGVYQTVSPSDEYRRLSRTSSGWTLRELDGTVHTFGVDGRWLRTEDRHGNAKVATYAGDVLTTVGFPDGRSETFGYHPDGKLASITEVGVGGGATQTWSYTWTGLDLVRIDRPDGTSWIFRYGDPALPGYITRMILVGTDDSERVEGAWEYDFRGNVLRTWRGDESFTGPAAVDTYSFAFDNPFRPETATVTDAFGEATTYEVGRDPGGTKPRLTRQSGKCASCATTPEVELFYDDPSHPLRPTREIDGRGTLTRFEYDTEGQLTARIDAVGTPRERTTRWHYDANYPALVTAVERPSVSGSGLRRSSWTYDANGNALVQTQEGFESGAPFTLATTSVFNDAGRALEVDPPGFGTNDRSTFTYDASRGDLLMTSQTDPLVGTTIFEYDAFNRRRRTIDFNGVATESVFDSLDRVLTVTRKGASVTDDLVTRYEYTVFGDLARIILPEGNVVSYGYDRAGRVVTVERRPDTTTPGERVLYTLDRVGHRIRQEHQVWEGGAWQTRAASNQVYNSRCQLDHIELDDGSTREFAYDCNGNLEREWDANHPSNAPTTTPSRILAYDELDRLTTVTEPWGGAEGGSVVTPFRYDAQDHPIEIVDPNGSVTRYTWSDRDLLTEEVSEVSGRHIQVYDEHGRLVEETDGRGISITYIVDALGRALRVDHPGTEQDVDYVFDDPLKPFSRGRLTAIHRGGETLVFGYDRFGRLVEDGELIYEYDRNGNRTSITYPGGVTVRYGYDDADRPVTTTLERAGEAPTALVISATYLPVGPLSKLVMGNGLIEEHLFDNRYLPSAIRVAGHLDWTYSTDPEGNVTAITDNLEPTASRAFTYQGYQYYLTGGDGPWGNFQWSYDRIGNRLVETRDGITTSYTYAPNDSGGNSALMVSQETGSASRSVLYDDAGQLSHRSSSSERDRHRFGADGRLLELRRDGVGTSVATEMRYDGRAYLREAVAVHSEGPLESRWTTRATYGSDGRLYHRSIDRPSTPRSPRNAPTREQGDTYIVYFAGRPIAQLSLTTITSPDGQTEATSDLLYLSTDHLGTPILATDASGAERWSGGFEPFGGDFGGAREAGIFLRLPGQWEDDTWSTDGESLHYNVHRWYDPSTGRFTQPDPLGLRAGVNLVVYVFSNPVVFIDPDGRREIVFTGCDVWFLDDDNKVVKRCDAGSGTPGSSFTDQDKKNVGPIPEGEWFINPREFSGGWLRDIIRPDGWGRWRVPIHPADDTKTHGRSGFFLHGDNRSDSPGSLGCVDIGDCDTWARDWAMERPDEPIKVTVSYASGKVCN